MDDKETEFVKKILLEYPMVKTDKLLKTVNTIRTVMNRDCWNHNIERDIYNLLIKEKSEKIRKLR